MAGETTRGAEALPVAPGHRFHRQRAARPFCGRPRWREGAGRGCDPSPVQTDAKIGVCLLVHGGNARIPVLTSLCKSTPGHSEEKYCCVTALSPAAQPARDFSPRKAGSGGRWSFSVPPPTASAFPGQPFVETPLSVLRVPKHTHREPPCDGFGSDPAKTRPGQRCLCHCSTAKLVRIFTVLCRASLGISPRHSNVDLLSNPHGCASAAAWLLTRSFLQPGFCTDIPKASRNQQQEGEGFSGASSSSVNPNPSARTEPLLRPATPVLPAWEPEGAAEPGCHWARSGCLVEEPLSQSSLRQPSHPSARC